MEVESPFICLESPTTLSWIVCFSPLRATSVFRCTTPEYFLHFSLRVSSWVFYVSRLSKGGQIDGRWVMFISQTRTLLSMSLVWAETPEFNPFRLRDNWVVGKDTPWEKETLSCLSPDPIPVQREILGVLILVWPTIGYQNQPPSVPTLTTF